MNHQLRSESNDYILINVFIISPANICPMFTFNYIAHKLASQFYSSVNGMEGYETF